MSMPLNATTYRNLIAEDIEWLCSMPRTLEREHILLILKYQHLNAEEITAMDRERARLEPQP